MPHSTASPASSPVASSVTANTSASVADGAASAGQCGDREPNGMGTHGRVSDRTHVATSSYRSACRVRASSSVRARSRVSSPRSMR